jgi:hypothetical protein
MLHFSWDQMIKRKVDPATKQRVEYDMTKVVTEKVKMLCEYGIPSHHLTFYMLIGFDTTLEDDLHRFHTLNNLGCHVYAMMFRDLNGKVGVDGKGQPQSPHVKPLRDWINGHAFRTVKNFHEFDRYKAEIKKLEQLTLFDEVIA